jgi:hypothetical protein
MMGSSTFYVLNLLIKLHVVNWVNKRINVETIENFAKRHRKIF